MARSGLIAGGNWITDKVKLIDAWPPQDALANILSESAANGGSAYNILKDLARLGAPFPLEAVGLIGDDADGRLIRADCEAHRIGTAQLRVTRAAATSYTDVMTVRATGRRTFFHQRGANALLGPEHFDFAGARAKIFHLGYLLLLDALDALGPDGRPVAATVLARARAAGLITSVDCVSEAGTRFQSHVVPVLPEVDLLFANDFEAEQLTGLAVGRGESLDRRAVERAARALLARGVRSHVVVHFPEGVCACSASGEVVWQDAVRVPPELVAGSTGAGDALASGVLYGVHEGWSWPRALELGVCAAAVSLGSPTCSEALCAADSCLEFGRRHGFLSGPD